MIESLHVTKKGFQRTFQSLKENICADLIPNTEERSQLENPGCISYDITAELRYMKWLEPLVRVGNGIVQPDFLQIW